MSEAICHANGSKHSYRSYFLPGNYLKELHCKQQFQLMDDAYESKFRFALLFTACLFFVCFFFSTTVCDYYIAAPKITFSLSVFLFS